MTASGSKEETLEGGRRVPAAASPPEGGWGWTVVAACFLATICIRAVTRCVSVFFVEFQLHFEKDYSTTAWIHSITDATTMLCGAFLGNWLSCRVTIILGGLLSSAGLILSSCASSVEQLYICTGVLTGLGFALSYTPAIAMVGVYFRERKALAYGIAMSGSGIGTFVLAPTVQMFIEFYSWRGALLLLGGLVSNLCVCGALMRPLQPSRARRPPERENSNAAQVEPKPLEVNAGLVLAADRGLSVYGFDAGKLGQESAALLSAPCLRGLTDRKLTNCILFSNKLTGTMLGEAKLTDPKTATRQDPAWGEGIKCDAEAGGGDAEKEEPALVYAPTKPDSGCCFGLRENRDFSFLLAPRFLVLSVSICFMAYGCSAPVVHLVPYALSLGLQHQQAAFLMAIFGASGIAGNITFGWIMDRKYLTRYRLLCYMLALGMEGLCCLLAPLLHSFPLLLTFSVFYGIFDGAYVALIPVVTSDVVDSPNLTTALGVVYFLHAVPYLVSPPIGGWLVDRTGNYHATFILSGVSFMLSAVVLTATRQLKRHHKSTSASADHQNIMSPPPPPPPPPPAPCLDGHTEPAGPSGKHGSCVIGSEPRSAAAPAPFF